MAEVRRTLQAEIDLDAILTNLNQKNPALAERYADAFVEKAKVLGQFPEIGRSRPEIGPNLRSTLVHPYVVFYRIDGETVQILRILHGRLDLPSIMKAESE
jgi:toxin ParE1/3/4